MLVYGFYYLSTWMLVFGLEVFAWFFFWNHTKVIRMKLYDVHNMKCIFNIRFSISN